MATRIIFAIIVASIVTSLAHGQMRYSRERKSSPTPSPTPTPTPAQPMAPAQGQSRIPARQSAAVPTPTPSKQAYQQVYRQPQAFVQPTPSPLIPARQATTSQPALQRIAPTPTPSRQVYLPSQQPAQKTASTIQSTQSAFRQPQAPPQPMAPAPTPAKPTPTPVPPPDVKAYLDRQITQSKDKKFHMTVNGKDVGLAPFHYWAARSTGFNTTATHIDMRDDDGRVYDIEFATSGAQISSIRIHRINGEAVR